MAEFRFLAKAVPAHELARALMRETLTWIYAERPGEIVLTWTKDFFATEPDLTRWPHGRAFGATEEVAWWQDVDQSFQVRTFATAQPAFSLGAPDPFAGEYRPLPAEKLLLMGEQDTNRESASPSWSAARIPRYLHYPLHEKPTRVALNVIRYTRGGMICEQRFTGLTSGEVTGEPVHE